MIFNNKKIYLNESNITIAKKTIPISYYEFLNSQKQQSKLLKNIPQKSINIILENSLKTHYKSILSIFQNKNITVKTISLPDKTILYQKNIDYRYSCILLISITLIIWSSILSITKKSFSTIQKELSKTKKTVTLLLNQHNETKQSIFTTTTTLINSLLKKPLLIQTITISPPKRITFLVYSYETNLPYIDHQLPTLIKQLTNHKQGGYYEITYIL